MPKKQPSKNYEELGKMVASIYESGYLDHQTSYKMSFIKGILSGLGGVIGATVLVAVLLWLLTFFRHVPFLSRISDNVKSTINSQQK